MKNLFIYCCVTLFVLAMSGCVREISSSSYDAKTLGTSNETFECTVIKVRQVVVQEGDYLRDNATGGIIGAVAGGAIGNSIGGGRGRTLATVAGATAGALSGAYAERSLSKQNALEYTVRLSTGELRTVVQGVDNALYTGQSALLIIDNNGRSRLVAK